MKSLLDRITAVASVFIHLYWSVNPCSLLRTWTGRAVTLMSVHLAHASAVETQWFAMYEVWTAHAGTLEAARHSCRKWWQIINKRLFGAELMRVALSALVSGNPVAFFSPWERHFQIVANDWKHHFIKIRDFGASHFSPKSSSRAGQNTVSVSAQTSICGNVL